LDPLFGGTATIKKIDGEYQDVYNFTVEGSHSYFVGKNGVLVSNQNKTP